MAEYFCLLCDLNARTGVECDYICSDQTKLSICFGMVLGISYFVCYGPQ